MCIQRPKTVPLGNQLAQAEMLPIGTVICRRVRIGGSAGASPSRNLSRRLHLDIQPAPLIGRYAKLIVTVFSSV